MPYIEVKTSFKMEENQKDTLKSKLGELISIIPGKREEVLMICIDDACSMYFSGEKKEKLVFLEVKLFKQSAFDSKAEFTGNLFEFFEKEFGVSGSNFFMTFGEFECWGSRGSLRN